MPYTETAADVLIALSPTPNAARLARRALHEKRLPEDLEHTVGLLATELIANAIRHGGLREQDKVIFAARFVSGYVYSPTACERRTGGGNTHAWVRVYLPGSGWVEFDPTNGIVGNRGLIRVAIARDIYQAVPVSGTWTGFPGSFQDMTVSVDISVDPTVSTPHSLSASGR